MFSSKQEIALQNLRNYLICVGGHPNKAVKYLNLTDNIQTVQRDYDQFENSNNISKSWKSLLRSLPTPGVSAVINVSDTSWSLLDKCYEK